MLSWRKEALALAHTHKESCVMGSLVQGKASHKSLTTNAKRGLTNPLVLKSTEITFSFKYVICKSNIEKDLVVGDTVQNVGQKHSGAQPGAKHYIYQRSRTTVHPKHMWLIRLVGFLQQVIFCI